MKRILIAEVTISQTIEYDISVEVHNVESNFNMGVSCITMSE